MSPSESDLRAALQDGDDSGSRISANSIIAQGQAIRARRMRILSGAAAVLVVAGGAVGIALARGNGSGSSANEAGGGGGRLNDLTNGGTAGDAQKAPERVPAAPQPTAPAGAAASSASSATVPGPASGGALYASRCPDSAPHLLAPGGGGPGQFGADHPLFSKPVDTLIVCVYGTTPATASGVPGRLTFTGNEATEIVTSMEGISGKPTLTPCDAGPPTSGKLLDFIGVTASGKQLPPVTATVNTPACNVQLTNGTAARYGWTPPAVLTDQLGGLTPPRSVRTVPDEPTNVGSPIHS